MVESGAKRPTDVDKLVGANIRSARRARKITQTTLATELGISFQQLQKYEAGTNRVAAGTLFRIAQQLGMPISAFYKGAIEDVGPTMDDQHELYLAAADLLKEIRHSNALPTIYTILQMAARAEAAPRGCKVSEVVKN